MRDVENNYSASLKYNLFVFTTIFALLLLFPWWIFFFFIIIIFFIFTFGDEIVIQIVTTRLRTTFFRIQR
jgi:hypothetical protein